MSAPTIEGQQPGAQRDAELHRLRARVAGLESADENANILIERLQDQRARLLTLIADTERFIAGFEGDELQEGVAELLARMRRAQHSPETLA